MTMFGRIMLFAGALGGGSALLYTAARKYHQVDVPVSFSKFNLCERGKRAYEDACNLPRLFKHGDSANRQENVVAFNRYHFSDAEFNEHEKLRNFVEHIAEYGQKNDHRIIPSVFTASYHITSRDWISKTNALEMTSPLQALTSKYDKFMHRLNVANTNDFISRSSDYQFWSYNPPFCFDSFTAYQVPQDTFYEAIGWRYALDIIERQNRWKSYHNALRNMFDTMIGFVINGQKQPML